MADVTESIENRFTIQEKLVYPNSHPPREKSLPNQSAPTSGFKVKFKQGNLLVQYTNNPWKMHLLSGRDRHFIREWLQVCPASRVYLDPKIDVTYLEIWCELAKKYGKKTFLVFERTRQSPPYRYPRQWLVKRCCDWWMSLGLLLLTTPLWLTIGFLWCCLGHRQILRRQWCVGEGGKLFLSYQFNCQVTSEAVGVGSFFTVCQRWLQNSAMGRLPLLLNVLRGEMGLLGICPRSIMDVLAMSNQQRRYLNIAPGIFPIPESGDLQDCTRISNWELEYLKTWSLWKEMQMLAKLVMGRR